MYNNRCWMWWNSIINNDTNIQVCRCFLAEDLAKNVRGRLSKQVRKRKYLIRNIFPNFHFEHVGFILYIQRYHSSPTQVFIKFVKSCMAACLNNWVVIFRLINSIKFKMWHKMVIHRRFDATCNISENLYFVFSLQNGRSSVK